VKAYAKHWGYDFVDATKTVSSAVTTLQTGGGDPSFIRIFAILRHLPLYDWVFWHDPDSVFLNFSRPLDDHVESHVDFVLSAAPCGASEEQQLLNLGHFFVQNTKGSLATLRSVWGLWNHTSCKYGEKDLVMGHTKLCDKGRYWQGDKGALMSVIGNCEECGKRVKYTGFRAFNSLYPCHAEGDLLVHFPGLSEKTRRNVTMAFLKSADLETGSFDTENPLLAPNCRAPTEHSCSTRKDCDRVYHGLNTHGKCPPSAAAAKQDHQGKKEKKEHPQEHKKAHPKKKKAEKASAE
jgi:hypothetical protein